MAAEGRRFRRGPLANVGHSLSPLPSPGAIANCPTNGETGSFQSADLLLLSRCAGDDGAHLALRTGKWQHGLEGEELLGNLTEAQMASGVLLSSFL